MQTFKRKLDRELMQHILDCFVELTGIRAAYFDDCLELINGMDKEICKFCVAIRKFSSINNGCIKSDRDALKVANETGKPHLYKCHNGLWEAIVPIMVRYHPAGYLMLGQVRDVGEDVDGWKTIKGKLELAGASSDCIVKIAEAYRQVYALDGGKMRAAVKMLDIIAQHIINIDVIRIYELEAIEKARNFLKKKFREHITAKMVAEAAGLSSSYLSFLFKKETGNTIIRFLETLRLNYVKELLLTTSVSIKEITGLAGYNDQNYLSRLFKKRFEISPVEYRQKNKNKC